jgi:hypothetical protein
MATSGGLHESGAYQRAYFKDEISENMSKHVPSSSAAILQKLHIHTL